MKGRHPKTFTLAEVEGLAALLVSSSATDRLDDVAD
jgi:hypothetical protein